MLWSLQYYESCQHSGQLSITVIYDFWNITPWKRYFLEDINKLGREYFFELHGLESKLSSRQYSNKKLCSILVKGWTGLLYCVCNAIRKQILSAFSPCIFYAIPTKQGDFGLIRSNNTVSLFCSQINMSFNPV